MLKFNYLIIRILNKFFNLNLGAMKTNNIFGRYMKQLIIIFFGMFIFHNGIAQVVNGSPPLGEQMKETAKETVKAYEAGNWEVLRKNAAPDAMFYNLGSYDSLTLDQTINYWTKGRETATPVLTDDGVWMVTSVPDGPRKGNWVLHWGKNTLSYPAGETISFPYHVALKFKDEKVQEAHFYYDNNRIIRAMGYEIQPPMQDLNEDLEIEDKDH